MKKGGVVVMDNYILEKYYKDSDSLEHVKQIVTEWATKQGHDRCWYYPDLFRKLVEVLKLDVEVEKNLPPQEEFSYCCKQYEKEIYEKGMF
jgi:hypothetical protein